MSETVDHDNGNNGIFGAHCDATAAGNSEECVNFPFQNCFATRAVVDVLADTGAENADAGDGLDFAVSAAELRDYQIQGVRAHIDLFRPELMAMMNELQAYAQATGLRFVMPDVAEIKAICTFMQWYKNQVIPLEKPEKLFEEERVKIDQWVTLTVAGKFNEARDVLASMRYQNFIESGLKVALELIAWGEIGSTTGAEEAHAPHGRTGTSIQAAEFSPAGALRDKGEFEYKHVLTRAGEDLKSLTRYTIEQLADYYHGGRFTSEYLASVLGFADVEELFFKTHHETYHEPDHALGKDEPPQRRKIMDFGSGDGDGVVEMAGKKRTIERISTITNIFEMLSREAGIIPKNILISPSTSTLIKEALKGEFNSDGINISLNLEPIDPNIIALDQAEVCLQKLRHPQHGIHAIRANISDPQFCKKLENEHGIEKNSVGVVMTTLTLDRVPNVDQLFANMHDMLEEDGRCMIATKGIIDPVSDGAGANNEIRYSDDRSLKAKTPAETVEKLRVRLAQHGIKIETLSIHPYKVTSTDGLQDYDLLVVAGKKMTVEERQEWSGLRAGKVENIEQAA